jgi:hypothetical protein
MTIFVVVAFCTEKSIAGWPLFRVNVVVTESSCSGSAEKDAATPRSSQNPRMLIANLWLRIMLNLIRNICVDFILDKALAIVAATETFKFLLQALKLRFIGSDLGRVGLGVGVEPRPGISSLVFADAGAELA